MENINLAGNWQYAEQLGKNIGVMQLPGTVQEQGYGQRVVEPSDQRWGREFIYEGKIFFSKTIDVKPSWEDSYIELILERVHFETTVYINDQIVSMHDSLSAAQRHELTGFLKQGQQVLTICVDNTMKYNLKDCTHHLSQDTQGNWNGIIGDMRLNVHEQTRIRDIQVHTNIEPKKIKVNMILESKVATAEDINIAVDSLNEGEQYHIDYTENCLLTEGELYKCIEIDMGQEALLWDEFACNLYNLTVEIGKEKKEVTFGLREISTKDKMICINNKKVFLRGSQDACVFPLTGAPPMDVEGWLELFNTYKAYGLNHFRAHSWCPPEAAFEAADRVGIYMQVEAPASGALGVGQTEEGAYDPMMVNDNVQEYIEYELERIQKAYGNHPSFVMLAIGNELYSDTSYTNRLVKEAKARDSRYLCTSGSNNNWSTPSLGQHDDFFVGVMIDRWQGLLRGSYHLSNIGHINNKRPSTNTTYTEASDKIHLPVITHEIGQYLAYPNYDEIDKYTGAMKPYHLMHFKQSMDENGMEGMDKAFSKASGALQVRLYKEEVEAALRSGNIAGFQLLDIKDFPGQAAALCGILDSFGESKGFIEPKEWRNFCGEVVPLAILPKLVFIKGEEITFEFKVTNYALEDIKDVQPKWQLGDLSGSLDKVDIKQGELMNIATITIPTDDIVAPSKQILTLSVGPYTNCWEVWLYPSEMEKADEEDILVTYDWNQEIECFVEAGGKVLYVGNRDNLLHTIKGSFQNNFWATRMFERYEPAGTVGLLIDEEHPVFETFPTENHSNWQWFDIVRYATPIQLKYVDEKIKPIVQVIDGYESNLKLGLLFEVAFGKGKIVVSAFDLLQHISSPVVLQYYNSIINYLKEDGDSDVLTVNPRLLDSILCVTQSETAEYFIETK